MKVLIVCRSIEDKLITHGYRVAEFVYDQAESLRQYNVEVRYFLIEKGGVFGYLLSLPSLLSIIKDYKPNILHAHYGTSGLLANFQRRVPVVTTFHGSDINNKVERLLSFFVSLLSRANIFVSEDLAKHLKAEKYIIPCGVDLEMFRPIDKQEARVYMNLNQSKKYILFSSSFNKKVKNPELAIDAVDLLKKRGVNCELLELRGFNRKEVNLLLNASDVALMTSKSEGSPQFIKEALACERPIVTTDVGDIKKITQDIKGVFISEADPHLLAKNLEKAILYNEKIDSRLVTESFDLGVIAKKIIQVYNTIHH